MKDVNINMIYLDRGDNKKNDINVKSIKFSY